MIALEIMGPVNDVVVPTILKKEKKRNSFPRGVTSEICFFFRYLLNLNIEMKCEKIRRRHDYWGRGVGRGREGGWVLTMI